MPKFKYQAGDKLGPYSIMMIKRSNKIGNRWKGIFLCPFCQKEFECLITNITTGQQKSCGCQKNKGIIKNLTNQKFGKLIALYPTKQRCSSHVVWYCKCDCGKYINVSSDRLQNGNTQSCGCLERSNGEQEIKNILDQNHLRYKEQYRIHECRDKNPLPFDFAIFDKQNNLIRLIEFDGEHHFKQREGWTDIEDIRRKDNIKTQYCKKFNIPLVRLTYHQRGKLSLHDLLGDDYLV